MRIAPRPHTHPAAVVQFWCGDCGRFLTIVGRDAPFGGGDLCFCCAIEPGWFRDPDLRAAIAPEHDGLDVHERDDRRSGQGIPRVEVRPATAGGHQQ